MKKSLLFLLFLSSLWLLAGCGGGTSGPPPPLKAITITFASGRALDGSDAVNAPNSTLNIWVVNADGSGTTPVTKLTANNADSFRPVWSPDGSKIAFNSGRALDGSDAANSNVTFNIWVMNADGSGATPLTKLTASGADSLVPAWSPDGSKIMFVSARAFDGSNARNATDNQNIWVMNADGSGGTPVTKLTAIGTNPIFMAWSPDGSKIAFSSSRALDGSDAFNAPNGTENIWIVNADGSGATPITKFTTSGADSFAPVWSPGGRKIAFGSTRALDGSDAANANRTSNIWVMNADGSGATPLTKLTAVQAVNIVPGIWLPDGSKIVFVSARALDGTDAANSNGTRNIWIMNADGSSAASLTKLTVSGADSFL
jgi:Tol biopolymer transport system component